MANREKPTIIIAETIKPVPQQHEIDIAWILAQHYRCSIEFLHPTGGYKAKTADVVMNGVMWEIKSPTGASRATVENQFKRGLHQSRYVVIDSRRTKLKEGVIRKQIEVSLRKHLRTKRVILISKQGEVIEILR